jgi:hypothetical protein
MKALALFGAHFKCFIISITVSFPEKCIILESAFMKYLFQNRVKNPQNRLGQIY